MKLLGTDLGRSPLSRDRVRLSGRVRYRSGAPREESLWFEVPEELESEVSRSGDPWLVVLLPLAATLGEDLVLPLPVDPVLRSGCRDVVRVWQGWYGGLYEPDLVGPVEERGGRAGEPRSGALFSGGVDSFFTLLRHEEDGVPGHPPLTDLLTVWGLDVALSNRSEGSKLASWSGRVASEAEKRAVFMATNVRDTRWSEADWSKLSHGALLVGCALTLQSRYRLVLVPSSVPYVRSRRRWGSHPLTDPMLSTGSTRVVHDGACARRTEKTARIARSELAMRHLRVCWAEGTTDNCGRCAKCRRTIATLEVVDALQDCTTFPDGAHDLDALARTSFASPAERRMLERVIPFAVEHGRFDVADAVETAVRRGRRREAVADALGKLGRMGLPRAAREAVLRVVDRGLRR